MTVYEFLELGVCTEPIVIYSYGKKKNVYKGVAGDNTGGVIDDITLQSEVLSWNTENGIICINID